MEKLFVHIYQYFSAKRLLFYTVLAIVSGIVLFGASRINIEDDALKMLPDFGKSFNILSTLKTTKLSEKIVVLVHANTENTDNLATASDEFHTLLQDSLSNFIATIKHRSDDEVSMDFYHLLQQKFPLFLTENDYSRIDSMLSSASIAEAMQQNYK